MTANPLTASGSANAQVGSGVGAESSAPASSPQVASSPQGENPNGVLGQNDFLKLMVAQLQAQNPLEPGNPNEFINELATITQVEQETNLANANELSGAVGLIGHTVIYNGAKGSVTGTVQSVQSSAEGTTVTVASSPQGEGVPGVKLSAITNIE